MTPPHDLPASPAPTSAGRSHDTPPSRACSGARCACIGAPSAIVLGVAFVAGTPIFRTPSTAASRRCSPRPSATGRPARGRNDDRRLAVQRDPARQSAGEAVRDAGSPAPRGRQRQRDQVGRRRDKARSSAGSARPQRQNGHRRRLPVTASRHGDVEGPRAPRCRRGRARPAHRRGRVRRGTASRSSCPRRWCRHERAAWRAARRSRPAARCRAHPARSPPWSASSASERRRSTAPPFAAFDTATAQQLFLGGGTPTATPGHRGRRRLPGAAARRRRRRDSPTGGGGDRGPRLGRGGVRVLLKAVSFLTTFLLIFAGIALVVGAFLIVNTFSILVASAAASSRCCVPPAPRSARSPGRAARGVRARVIGATVGLGLGVLLAMASDAVRELRARLSGQS